VKLGRTGGQSESARSDGSLPAAIRPIPLALLAYSLVWWIMMLFMGKLSSASDGFAALVPRPEKMA